MTGQLISAYKQKISELVLIPSGGGCFELTVDGSLLYSKLKEGRFPDEAAMVAAVGKSG